MSFNVIISSETAFSEVALAVLTAMLLENQSTQAEFSLEVPDAEWPAASGSRLEVNSSGVAGAGLTVEAFEHAMTRANFAISQCPRQPDAALLNRWNQECLRQDPKQALAATAFADIVLALRELFGSAEYAPYLSQARSS